MSKAFMLGIIDGEFWTMKSIQIQRIRVCADPPPRKDLSKIVGTLMIQHDFTLQFGAEVDAAIKATAHRIIKVGADVDWLLTILAQLEEDHPIFARDYVRPKKVLEDAVPSQHMVENRNGHFDGLPVRAMRAGGRATNLSSKKQKTALKLQQQEARYAKLERQMQATR